MGDKLSVYDILATLVPGTLVVGLVAIAVPDAAAHFKNLGLPDVFAVIVLTAVAIFAGIVVQAIGSFIDPFLYWTWSGSWGKYPSEVCLESGLGNRYLPKASAHRIRAKLAAAVKDGTDNRSLFLYAMQQAEGATNQRVSVFNGLFAYHRALLIATVVALAVTVAMVCGAVPVPWSHVATWAMLGVAFVLLLLFWHRTKQRAYYYVREVLLTAERMIDANPAAPAPAPLPAVHPAPPVLVGNGAAK